MVAATPSKLSRRAFLTRVAASIPIAAACVGPEAGIGDTTPHPVRSATSAPATRIGGELRVLQWSHPIRDFDLYVDGWAADWGARNGVTVRIDRIPNGDLPARLAAEAAAKSGHDLVGHFANSLPATFSSSLVDITDICDRAATRYGGWTPAAEAIGKLRDTWYAFPDFAVPFLNAWRTDAWRAAGYRKDHLEAWDDLFERAAQLKATGNPVGTAMSRTMDAEHTWRSLMWSYGAGEFSSDGATVAIDSKQTRQVLDLAKALFATEERAVLSWTDWDNDLYLASGKASWICNPLSAYRAVEARDTTLAAKIMVDAPLAGPVARLSAMQFTAYGIWSFSANVDAARRFLIDYSDDWSNQMLASKGLNVPFLNAHARRPMPGLGTDGKLSRLQDIAGLLRPIGYPGPPSRAAYDALNAGYVTTMFTSYCTGQRSADGAISEAAKGLTDSLTRFPV